MTTHETRLDRELQKLKRQLVNMANITEAMIDQAIRGFVNRDERYTADVQQEERELNQLQIDIDGHALALLATCQPVADDLRFIVAASKINSELERIGDLAVNITENVHVLVRQPPLEASVDIPRMAELARRMVCDSVNAFTTGDVQLAQSVRLADDRVDELRDRVMRTLLAHMTADPTTIEPALAWILVARHLERIGDQACNIAEEVIYIVEGRDVRHPKAQSTGHDTTLRP